MRIAAAWVLALTVGCGGDDELSTGLEGVYTISTWTENATSCAMEGASVLDSRFVEALFVRLDNFLGEQFLNVPTCATVAQCIEDAADRDTIFLGGYAFDSGSDAMGWTGTSALIGPDLDAPGMCQGEVTRLRLSERSPGVIEIRGEIVTVSGIPEDDDGFCNIDAARVAAEGLACERLEVLTATLVQGI